MIYLDTGHGLDNKVQGVYDPGAAAGGFTEAAVVRDVADEVLRLVPPAIVKLAPDGPLVARVKWQGSHLGPKDLLVSLHMNAGGGTGVEVYYAATKPEMRTIAMRFSRRMAYRLGLRDRGAKADDMSQHSQLGILRVPGIPSLLVEMGFIDNEDDLRAVHAGAANALAGIFVEGV